MPKQKNKPMESERLYALAEIRLEELQAHDKDGEYADVKLYKHKWLPMVVDSIMKEWEAVGQWAIQVLENYISDLIDY